MSRSAPAPIAVVLDVAERMWGAAAQCGHPFVAHTQMGLLWNTLAQALPHPGVVTGQQISGKAAIVMTR